MEDEGYGGLRMEDGGWRIIFLGTNPSHGHDPEGG